MVDGLRKRRLAPVVGGMTAAATAAGAVVTTTHVAPALAEPASADAVQGAAGGGGALESCSAYFGFGKEEGAINVVEFDVADIDGDDGATHAVPDDTEVALVIETGDGTVECTPEEVTETEWDDEWGPVPANLPFPGAGHYMYPSVVAGPEIGDPPSQVLSVGFRVTSVPDEHTLVSPTGLQPLVDHFQETEDFVGEDGPFDPRVAAVVEAGAGTAGLEALLAAYDECTKDEGEPEIDETDEDLINAINALVAYLDNGNDPVEEATCEDVVFGTFIASFAASVRQSAAYVEEIQPSTPEPTTTTSSTTTVPETTDAPAAQAVTATPTFTG